MLQIYIYGENVTEPGFLDIDPQTQLDLESLYDAFDEDFTFGEFSLPVDILWTDTNRKRLRFAERFRNGNKPQNWWLCNVYDDGFPELIGAKFSIIEKIGAISYLSGKFSATITGTKGLFGAKIKGKKLSDITFEKIPIAEPCREFASKLMKGDYPQYAGKISFAPVGIENFFDTGRSDYNNEFLVNDTVNNIVITGSGAGDWQFGRPQSADPGDVAEPGTAEYIDYRTVPFLNFKFVLKQIFAQFGFKVTGAVVDENTWNDVYIYNNYAIEVYAPLIFTDAASAIFPANHLPDMTVLDFLKAIFSFFKIFPIFNSTGVILKYKQSLFAARTVVDISQRASEFDSTLSNSEDDGYTINYTWNSLDQYHSDRVKDLADKTLVASVITAEDLADVSGSLTTDSIAFVQAENLYYVVANASSTPVKWEPYAEELQGYIVGGGSRNVDAGLSTLCTFVQSNATTGLSERCNYVGTRMAGNYVNSKGVRVVNDCGLSIFFIKKQTINGNNIPVSFNHNRDAANNKIEPYSLAMKGNDGIAKNFHLAWENMKQNMETAKVTIEVNRKVLNEMSAADAYQVNNVQFLPNKMERSIPARNTVLVYMVPI